MEEKRQFILNKLKERKEFVLSSELINMLKKNYPEIKNHRKIINEMCKRGIIKNSEPITFKSNNYAYAINEIETNYKNLKSLIKTEKKQLHRAICLIEREKIVSYNELAKTTGCVINELGNNVMLNSIIDDLKYFHIIRIENYKGINFFIGKDVDEDEKDKKIKILRRKNYILWNLIYWMKDSNIVDKDDMVTYIGEKNDYKGVEDNNLIWDGFFFTELYGTNSKKKVLGLIDFSTSNIYDWMEVEGFKSRIDILRNSVRAGNGHRKVFPIIFADYITESAKKKIREYKFLCIDIKKILGTNYELIIEEYLEFIKKAKTDNPIFDENIFEHIQKMMEGNDNYGIIKGSLFEYMMGEVFRKIFNENGTNIHHSENIGGREIDYRIETNNENICIELKAYKEENIIKLGDDKTEYSFNWTLRGTYQKFLDKYKNSPNRKCKFCYITTSKFSDEVWEKGKSLNNSRVKPDKLECLYDREKLKQLLKEAGCKKELDLINNYY